MSSTNRVARCQSNDCGMRYPSPVDDPRTGTCPRCDQPTDIVTEYPTPFEHVANPGEPIAVHVLVDNVRSALNVGTMLRAADGAGVNQVHLCGLTPAGDHPKVAKTSLGAEFSTAWSHHLDATSVAASWRHDHIAVWAVESTRSSIPLAEALGDEVLPSAIGFVVGNETAGVDPGLLELADRHVHLPMAGSKSTLNVGVALGAALYALRTAEALRAKP